MLPSSLTNTVVAAIVAGSALVSTPAAVAAPNTPARPAADTPTLLPNGDPTVAAVFRGTSSTHLCTASVIHSSTANVLITAAHCVIGSGTNLSVAPGYHDGTSPYGRWAVTAAYLDPSWVQSQDPQHDYAFLTVAPNNGHAIEDVTGSNTLGAAPPPSSVVVVVAYRVSGVDEPISCSHRLTDTSGYPTFYCQGFTGGTSGAPFLRTVKSVRTVVGVLGGLHRGGCSSRVSYSSPFGPDVQSAYLRAVAGGAGDVGPALQPGDC